MTTMKKFFIYVILIIAFFGFSKLMIYLAIDATYANKELEIKTSIPIEAKLEASPMNGNVKGKIINNTGNAIENKYIKLECYSEHNVLMGTKYILIDKINENEEREFEIHFDYDKVVKGIIDIVDNVIPEKQTSLQEDLKLNTSEKSLAILASGIILMIYFL